MWVSRLDYLLFLFISNNSNDLNSNWSTDGADQEATPREKWSPIQERKNRNKELIGRLQAKRERVSPNVDHR